MKILMKMLTLLITLTLFLTGCEEVYLRNPFSTKPPVVVHVMTPDDYFVIPPSAIVEWDDMMVEDPDCEITDYPCDLIFVPGDLEIVQKWGSFYSNEAQNQVMEAKVDN